MIGTDRGRMIGSTDPNSIKLHKRGDEKPGCCKRFRRCCYGCCPFILALLGVMAFVFWPRKIFMCVDYSRTTTDIQLSLAPPQASVSFDMPVSVDSDNFWGVTLKNVGVEGYYQGEYDAALSRGSIDDLTLKMRGSSSFNVSLAPADLSAAQLGSAVSYFTEQCGALGQVLDPDATWLLDLKVTVEMMSFSHDFWIRDLEMPCHNAPAGAGGYVGSTGGYEDGELRPPDGKYCIELLCAIDDLTCEKSCPSEGSSSPAAPPPAAPPSLLLG